MADLTSLQMAVLQVLSWQTPDYLCSPDASAFISQALEEPEEIEKALIAMQGDELVEFYTVEEHIDIIKVERDEHGEPILNEPEGTARPMLDEEGQIQLETVTRFADSGWIITDKGRVIVKSGSDE